MDQVKEIGSLIANVGLPAVFMGAVIHLLYKHLPDFLTSIAKSWAVIAKNSERQTHIMERTHRRVRRTESGIHYASMAAEKYILNERKTRDIPSDVLTHILLMRASSPIEEDPPSNGKSEETETL